MKPYRIITLGCKVNQCESAAIGHLLEQAGWREASENSPADAIVINTCTVTGRAAMQSRQAIRQAIRNNPTARIVVTGCHAQTAADQIRTIQGVDLIVGNPHKLHIADLLEDPQCRHGWSDVPTATAGDFTALPAVHRRARTRAFLKIQDGCNTRCTYCIVPYARGPSRSMPVADVRAHLDRLGAAGIREVVLTGIHLGAYGSDLQPATSLADLLVLLTSAPSVERIRLSSIEPTEVDNRLVGMMAVPGGVLCRHLHIPLQSGDNDVLRRMGRPYRREDFARIVTDIVDRIPFVAIGVDVMAGFPGETEEAFFNTVHLIETLPITYLHVFPFSPRQGTPAAAFKGKVPQIVIKERCRILRELGAGKKMDFYKKMPGHRLTVLIETVAQGTAKGLSDNYVPVAIPEARVAENTLVRVRVENVMDDGTVIGNADG